MTVSTATPPPELRRVIALLLVNLGLSAVLAVLFAAFHDHPPAAPGRAAGVKRRDPGFGPREA